jgi:hypothetical protein
VASAPRKTTKTPAKVVVKVYDGDDSVVNNSGLPMQAFGVPGNDRLVGGPQADLLHGEDVCDRSAGNDELDGDRLAAWHRGIWFAMTSTVRRR